MTRTSQPTRLPIDVYEAAATAATLASRSVPQQVAHWARIGREFEMSPQVNHRAVARVLAGRETYDELGEPEQALVRQAWAERADDVRHNLNYEAEFVAGGESYSEARPDGSLVVHRARG